MPIEKKNLFRVMDKQQNVALVPGGVHEMMRCQPFAKDINISIKHKVISLRSAQILLRRQGWLHAN